jgi:hypothetical protein
MIIFFRRSPAEAGVRSCKTAAANQLPLVDLSGSLDERPAHGLAIVESHGRHAVAGGRTYRIFIAGPARVGLVLDPSRLDQGR